MRATTPDPEHRLAGDCEQFFLGELGLINRVAASVARRHRLCRVEAEDFGSLVRLKLIEDDYAVLRRFEGRSRLSTYLTTVVERLYLDYRDREWGKWRPSAAARREGVLAIRLEELVVRDGLTFDEACERLAAERHGAVNRRTLDEIWIRLPARSVRRWMSEDHVAELPDPRPFHDAVAADERRLLACELTRALARSVAGLPRRDRLILQLRFGRGLGVAEISRSVPVDAKLLYRRIHWLLRQIREHLEAEGFHATDAVGLIGGSELARER